MRYRVERLGRVADEDNELIESGADERRAQVFTVRIGAGACRSSGSSAFLGRSAAEREYGPAEV
jgi:hypothetical protein